MTHRTHSPLLTPGTVLSLGLAAVLTAGAADWPQYRGPNDDGTTAEKVAKWPAAGPKVLWKVPTPTGFSSFAVSQGKAFTVVKRSVEGADREMGVALDANTGKEL